jgi:hypothetical protein
VSSFTETHIGITGPGIDLFFVSVQLGHEEFANFLSPLIAALSDQHEKQSSPAPASLADELSKLGALKEQGLISQDEFETLKLKLISG